MYMATCSTKRRNKMSDVIIGCGIVFDRCGRIMWDGDVDGEGGGMCGFDGLCPTCMDRATEEEMEESGKTWKQARAAVRKYYRGE